MAKTVTIQGRIVKPLSAVDVHGFKKGHVSIFNPEYQVGGTEKKYLDVYFKKWAGLKNILTRGRTIVFTGYYNIWEYENIGKVFICQEVRELTLDDVTPKAPTNQVFEEYAF